MCGAGVGTFLAVQGRVLLGRSIPGLVEPRIRQHLLSVFRLDFFGTAPCLRVRLVGTSVSCR